MGSVLSSGLACWNQRLTVSSLTTVDIYGHLVPEAWDGCRDVMQRAMRPGALALTLVAA
jgi:hypothetical protein